MLKNKINSVILICFLILLVSGCSTHVSTLKHDDGYRIYTLDENETLQIVYETMLSIVDDEIVNELPGPVKGYKTRLTWGLDWYDVIVRVVPVRGKTIQGKSIQGHFVELGGKGTYPTQRPQEIIDEITKKLNGTNTMVVVESIERGSYSTQRNLPIVTSGTGWFSESGYFITNHHVVEGAKVIKVQYRGKEYPAELVLKDEQNDIALLSITDACSMPPAFKFSQGKPQLGQVVFTVGFPQTGILGKSAKYASGEISSLRGIQDDPRFIQTSLPVHGGNSGGPLVNDKGEVVGMVTAKIDTMAFLEKTGDVAQNISYAIKRQYIEMLTSSVEKKTICGKIFEGKAAAQEQGLDLADIVVRVVAE